MKKLIYLLSFILLSNFGFSQTQNYWVKKADFAGLKRERAVSFVINNIGYVGTGVDTTDVVRKDFWSFNPATNSWTQVADFGGVERRNAVAFAANNKGYVGTGMSASVSSNGVKLSDFWEYNPTTNTWLQKSNFPGSFNGGIYFATAFSINNTGYICGGKRGPANYTDEFWEYKPATDTWSQLSAFPGGIRYQMASFVVNNKAYVGLGVDLDVFRKDLWEYNPALAQWTQKNDFAGSERGAVSTFAFNYRGFVCLGGDGGFKDDLWEYNPFTDNWSIRASFGGSARKNAISFTIGDTAYVGIGKGITGKKMSFWAYVPYKSSLKLDKNKIVHLTTYPNPVIDVLNVKLNTDNIKNLFIFDLMGKEIYNTKINNSFVSIKSTNFASGTYILVCTDNKGNQLAVKKILFK